MTAAADLILANATVHSLADTESHGDETASAVAVRDGRIVRVGETYEVEFLEGVETEVVDCEGKVLLPGFIDAHTHLEMVGRFLVHADLRDADAPSEALDRLRETAADDELRNDELVLGYGYDESTWSESRYLTREDLDAVTTDRPVVAFREDMHTASLNSAALDRFRDEMPDDDVQTEGGEATGVVVEAAVDPLFAATEPDAAETRELLLAAQERANELGVTGVHDMCRDSHKPRIFRELDAEGELTLRTRLNYWATHLDAVAETGLRTGHGSELVRTGAIKTYTDGTFGGRTAKLREPYEDEATDGQWVVDPEELAELVAQASDEGLQFAAHAIGDAAIESVLDVFAEADRKDARHRIEHAELLTDDLVERFAEVGAVASVQPNFLKWAREGGLYETRLGDRRAETMPFRDLLDFGVPLAFGSDCMPLDPLFGVSQAVTAPEKRQRLSVREALRAYTFGGAYAAGEEEELGTVEAGKRADLVVLDESPWAVEDVAAIDVALTVVDGEIVYES